MPQKEETVLRAQEDDVTKRLERIEEKASQQQLRVAEIKTKRAELRTRLTELRNPAALAELNAFEAKRKELEEQLGTTKNEQNALTVQEQQIHQPEIKRIADILKQLEREESKLAQEKTQVEKVIVQNTKQLEQAEAKSQKFRSKYRQLFEKRSELSKEIQQIEERIIRKRGRY